ncbi:MAG: HAD family hydrolase [Lachnospirales bacterium]
MCKLVVLDIDGTTLTYEQELTKRTKDTIGKVVANGIPVCLCTGRNIHNTRRIANELNLTTPIICGDGAVVINNNEEYIANYGLKRATVDKIMNFIKKENLYLEICTPEYYHKYIKNNELGKFDYEGCTSRSDLKEAYSKWEYTYFVHKVRYMEHLKDYAKDEEIISLLYAGDIEDVKKCTEFIKSLKDDTIEIRDDLWETYVFLVNKMGKKSHGLKAVAEYYNVDLKDVMAIGDQLNDLDMLKIVGMPIAMGNGAERIKEVSKYVTKTNDDEGVAHALEKFILSQ